MPVDPTTFTNAETDAKTLSDVVNGPATGAGSTVTTRTGLQIQTVSSAVQGIINRTADINTALANASQALSTANAAQATATAAATNASAALSRLDNIASDNILTVDEKPYAMQEYSRLTLEQPGIDAQATAYGITTEKAAYDAAITALTSYLNTLTNPVAWNITTDNTFVAGTTFRQKFDDVYQARQTLLNKIYGIAKASSDAASSVASSAAASAGYMTTLQKSSLPLLISWDSYLPGDWNVRAGSINNISQPAAKGLAGGSIIRAVGFTWIAWRYNEAYDPNRLYRVRCRVRQAKNPASGSYVFYAGLEGVAADGTTLVNATGVNSSSSQHYGPAGVALPAAGNAVDDTAPGAWQEFIFYWRGLSPLDGTGKGTDGGGGSQDPKAPAMMKGKFTSGTTTGTAGVAYVRPLLIFGYSAGGTANDTWMDCDILEVVADPPDEAMSVTTTTRNRIFRQAAPPTNPIAGYSLIVGDQWFNTDTTTNCPDVNCKGHPDANADGAPDTGSLPHRALYWAHLWNGSAWVDGDRQGLILASEISVGSLSAIKADLGTVTAGVAQSSDGLVVHQLNSKWSKWSQGSGKQMLVAGSNFGAGQYVLWAGAHGTGNVDAANVTDANASFYVKGDGSAFFGGKLRSSAVQAANISSPAGPNLFPNALGEIDPASWIFPTVPPTNWGRGWNQSGLFDPDVNPLYATYDNIEWCDRLRVGDQTTITAGVAWQPNTVYVAGTFVVNAGRAYVCVFGGTSAASGGPSTTGTVLGGNPPSDGSVTWNYLGVAANGAYSGRWVRCIVANISSNTRAALFPITPGDRVIFTAQVTRALGPVSSGVAGIGVDFWKADGGLSLGGGSANLGSPSSWPTYELLKVMTPAAPAGSVYARISWTVTAGSPNICYFDDMKVFIVASEDWIAPASIASGYVNYGAGYNPVGYLRDTSGWVHMKGLLNGAAATTNAILFTMPAGYRPLYNWIFNQRCLNGAARVDVQSGGNVVVSSEFTGNPAGVAGAWVTLDNIHFKAEQ